MSARLALVGLALVFTACASAPYDDTAIRERYAQEAKIRVTINPDQVRGCQSLGVVSANATDGYATAEPALRNGTLKLGGDTALLQDGSRVTAFFRTRDGQNIPMLMGPVGEAYRCTFP